MILKEPDATIVYNFTLHIVAVHIVADLFLPSHFKVMQLNNTAQIDRTGIRQ
jgi:hypothetical protein